MQLYLTMPQPGETITEGTIVEWLAKPGSFLKEGAPVASLETEKAIFEYESPFEGTFVKVLHDGGTRVKVAAPIAVMEVAEDKAQGYMMLGLGKPVDESVAALAKEKAQAATAKYIETNAPTQSTPATTNSHALKISPFVRQLAVKNNISEATLAGLADADGRVSKEAIENFISGRGRSGTPREIAGGATEISGNTHAGGSRTAPTGSSPQGDFETVACSAIRMRIADNMVLSKTKIPHAHNGIAVDLTRVIEFREKNKDSFKQKNGTALNLLSIIYPALIAAIKKVPVVNASYDDSTPKHQIKKFKKINLGIAAGTEHGLVIPVVQDIGSLNFAAFNKTLNDKLERATTQKLMPPDLMGATLIFNNFGFFGTQIGVQVIQYPMAATLGMSVIEKRAVVINDEIKIRTMSDFILSFDHRVMDGRETGIFLATLKKEIEALNFSHVP